MASRSNQAGSGDAHVDDQAVDTPPVEQTAEQPQLEQQADQSPPDSEQDQPAAEDDAEAAPDESEGGIVADAEELARKLGADLEELGIKIEAEGHAIVRLLVSLAGEKVKAPGDEHSCPPDEAVRLVRAGFAAPTA